MVFEGSQQETLGPGFVLFGTRQQDVPVILRKPMLLDGFDPVSPSFSPTSFYFFPPIDSCFLLTNARILDFPIVYVSNGFTNLTEFGRIEVMQKPGLCPFLHGPQTDKSIITTLENAFKEQKSEHVEVILYKKNCKSIQISMCIITERKKKKKKFCLAYILRLRQYVMSC
ncbi:unnamed protein product [Schistosoma margrebowiei]|uniref:PAS domain-containing protein n=1 Tax=Schistosoma margrebowiei TaxID=48269 RepID=A0A183MLG1_9TREM|nr:unnamed protein product [Schistosoma margrebowiei]